MGDDSNDQKSFNFLDELEIRLVPQHPSLVMCQTGSAAGDVDVETARRIYYAMLVVASNQPLHGTHSLN